MDEEVLLEFVTPYYVKKDAMHDLSHIQMLVIEAQSICAKYHVDKEVLTYAAYFHGINESRHASSLTRFLVSQGLTKGMAKKIMQVASESHKGSVPRTIEGKILHDAHLVVGGKEFMVTRFLITGAVRGFTIEHTINYFEEEWDRKFKCYLPETRRRYSEMEKFGRVFFRDLKRNLPQPAIQET